MKKMLYLLPGLCILLAMPALAMAETTQSVAAAIDWTPLVVAVIGVIGTALSALLARVWVRWVRPWLEKRDLTDAAKIVVEAVEALLGRYCGAEKWQLALKKMEDRGFNIDSEVVMDALRSAFALRSLFAGVALGALLSLDSLVSLVAFGAFERAFGCPCHDRFLSTAGRCTGKRCRWRCRGRFRRSRPAARESRTRW